MAEQSLIDAMKARDPAAVERALSGGANIDERDEQGWTALCRAAGFGDAALVRLLLDRGAEVTLAGTDGRTPLMIAKAAGRSEVVDILAAAEEERGVWKASDGARKYCKAYRVRDLRRYDRWYGSHAPASANEDALSDDDVVYLHQDLTVTRSMWPGEDVIFADETPEWRGFCEHALGFAVPADLL